METVTIPTSLIVMRRDARKVDAGAVRALASSIAEIGILNPLRVRASRGFVDGLSADVFEVIAGVHRLKAARQIGLETVPCVISDDDDLHAELAMIDENLCRAELSPADRASQTARRKAIYLQLHPETGHGKSAPDKDANIAPFHEATAEATGRSERAVQLDAERGEKISNDALRLVRGSRLDNGAYLDKLKRVPDDRQAERVRDDLAALRAPAPIKQPKLADDPLGDFEAQERQVASLMSAWNKASKEARAEFMLRVETPVFDGGA